MKITVGKLRQLIREARVQSLPEYQGFKVGEWYKDKDGGVSSVGKLTHLTVEKGPHGQYVMAMMSHGGHSSGRRFEFWSENKVPATPEDIKAAQTAWARESEWMSKHIDTSREGT